eukprot:4796037-Amphidinium_carterae.2
MRRVRMLNLPLQFKMNMILGALPLSALRIGSLWTGPDLDTPCQSLRSSSVRARGAAPKGCGARINS